MEKTENVRNFSLVGCGCGKEIVDILSSNSLSPRGINVRKECEEDTNTMKPATLFFNIIRVEECENQQDGSRKMDEKYVFNVIDTPSNVEMLSEVTASLRLSDGVVLLVDFLLGVDMYTETVLREMLRERIVPVTMFDNLDKAILDRKMNAENIYEYMLGCVNELNIFASAYEDRSLQDALPFSPSGGNVFFGSTKRAWGFSISKFAGMYAKKFGIKKQKLVDRLWGDNFFDNKSKTWSSKPISKRSGKKLERSFCQFCLRPIFQVFELCMEGKRKKLDRILKQIGIELEEEEKENEGKKLVDCVMRKFLNLHETLIETITIHLPSPVKSQKYRTELLYGKNDRFSEGITNIDSSAPLVMYVSKMIRDRSRPDRFYAFGRVFSGTIKGGQKVRILGDDDSDVHERKIAQLGLLTGGFDDPPQIVESVPCGNLCVVSGVDSVIVKSATIVDVESTACDKLVPMMRSLHSPLVHLPVQPKNASELPKLVNGLKMLSRSDAGVECVMSKDTGDISIFGHGKHHLDCCLRSLKEDFCEGMELVVGNSCLEKYVVEYRETVLSESDRVCMTKSPNRHNRLFMTAEPLSEELSKEIELKNLSNERKKRARYLSDNYGWDVKEARKIWCFGPEDKGPNILVNCTKGVQHLGEIQQSVKVAFQWATSCGILCSEKMRGIRFNLVDSAHMADAIHRGGGQIIPTTRRVLYASMYTAKPTLLEPVYECEVKVFDTSAIGSVYSLFHKTGGTIFAERSFKDVVIMKGYVPVVKVFEAEPSFEEMLRRETQGMATSVCLFAHWDFVGPGYYSHKDAAFNEKQKCFQIIEKVRKRKGMRREMPPLERFCDKL